MTLPVSRPPDDPTTFPALAIHLILHLFLANNLLPQTFPSLNAAFWSLSIEFQLYLLFPLLLIMTRRIGWAQMLVVTAFVEIVSRLALSLISLHEPQLFPSTWWGWNKLSPFAFWFSWSLGAMLAEAFVENKPIPFAKSSIPLWLWPLLVLALDHVPFLRNFDFPIAALGTAHYLAYFLSRDHSIPQIKPSLAVGALNFLGIISYSVYLIHWPVNRIVLSFCPSDLTLPMNFALRFAGSAASMVPTLILSYASYRLVELPGIALGKTLIKGFGSATLRQAA
jgi:peptidoglycan/LPS O-acetylase OafA/YrhL